MSAPGTPQPEGGFDFAAHDEFRPRRFDRQPIAHVAGVPRDGIVGQVEESPGLFALDEIAVLANLGCFNADHGGSPGFVAPPPVRSESGSGNSVYFCASFRLSASATGAGTNFSTRPPSAAISRTMLELT